MTCPVNKASCRKKVDLYFPGRIPSKKNSKRMVGRGSRTILIPSEGYMAWHKEAALIVAGTPLLRSPVKISYQFVLGDLKEFDLSNSVESINDLLVDCGVIEDDSWHHLQRLNPVLSAFHRGGGGCHVSLVELPRTRLWLAIDLLKNDAELKALAATRKCSVKKLKEDLEE
jgi:hypothetical protein